MHKKQIALNKKTMKAHAWIVYPAEKALADLTMYLEHLEEFYTQNLASINEAINKTSTTPIEVEMENGSSLLISEKELAIDYYEDAYYEDSYLFSSFLMEGYIFKAHQQLDRILRMYCKVAEESTGDSFEKFRSGYKKTPVLFVRGEYLRKQLVRQNDPRIRQIKTLTKQLEQISIVRNCLIHEDGKVKEPTYVNKVKQLFRTEKCGRLDQQHNPPLIILNERYPHFMLGFIKEYSNFIKPYLLEMIKWGQEKSTRI